MLADISRLGCRAPSCRASASAVRSPPKRSPTSISRRSRAAPHSGWRAKPALSVRSRPSVPAPPSAAAPPGRLHHADIARTASGLQDQHATEAPKGALYRFHPKITSCVCRRMKPHSLRRRANFFSAFREPRPRDSPCFAGRASRPQPLTWALRRCHPIARNVTILRQRGGKP
jgi:hypothetical protein